MPLTSRERELVAVGASVAAGSKPRVRHHLERVATTGATAEQSRLAIAEAVSARRRATEIMELHALQRVDPDSEADTFDPAFDTRRIRTLVSIAAAYAADCTSGLETHLQRGEKAGLTPAEISEVLRLAADIRGGAASQVSRLVGSDALHSRVQPAGPTAPACC
jgi:AhpD family alkylhydroperoxidase